jgi:hypothetical protein
MKNEKQIAISDLSVKTGIRGGVDALKTVGAYKVALKSVDLGAFKVALKSVDLGAYKVALKVAF